MRIAIDSTPLSSGHNVRGTGSYTKNLIEALQKYEKQHSYSFFTRGKNLPDNVGLVHYPCFDPFFTTLPLRKPKPVIVSVHDLVPLIFPDKFPRGMKGEIAWQIQKRSLRAVARIITDSQQSKEDIRRIVGYSPERIDVIPLAPAPSFRRIADKRVLQNVRKKYDLPERYLLYVGDVNWNKNITGMLQAFRKLKSQSSKLKLVLVGKAFTNRSLPEAKEIKDLIAKLKLTADIKILGFVPEEDLVAVYNLAAVYVQPSWYEGFGLPVLEAMACGAPVVCSYTASLKEIGGPAVSIDPGDVNNIASGILRVLSMENSERERLIREELAWARKFSWKTVAAMTVASYEKALA